MFSVGGGDVERNISVNLVNAMRYAKEVGAAVTGIVGRDGGAVAALGDVCVADPGGRPGDGDPADRGHAGADVAPRSSATPTWRSGRRSGSRPYEAPRELGRPAASESAC